MKPSGGNGGTTRSRMLLAALLLAAAMATGAWLLSRPTPPAASTVPGQSPAPARSPRDRAEPVFDESSRRLSDAASRRTITADWEDLLRWLETEPRPTSGEIIARFAETRQAWAEMDPQVLAGVLAELLESGDDRATGLDFKVGVHGLLSSWPSLRVFLLDVLATSDPELAAATARDVLGKTESANEFAIALRSLTRPGMGRADDAELLGHFSQLLDRPAWHSEQGFAEALDLARTIGTPAAAGKLAAWDGNPALKQMALHEFAAGHPAAMLEALTEDGFAEVLPEASRAQLLARADAADPEQTGMLEHYLRSPELETNEARLFLESFPLRSATTGYRLYGKTPAPYTRGMIAAGDRAALEMAERWAADPTLARHHPAIQELRQRLTEWVRQAEEEEAPGDP